MAAEKKAEDIKLAVQRADENLVARRVEANKKFDEMDIKRKMKEEQEHKEHLRHQKEIEEKEQ